MCSTRFDDYFAINRNICACALYIRTHKMSNVFGWCVCVPACLFVCLSSPFSFGSRLPFLFHPVCVSVSACSYFCYCSIQLHYNAIRDFLSLVIPNLQCLRLGCLRSVSLLFLPLLIHFPLYIYANMKTHTHIIVSSAHECMHGALWILCVCVCAGAQI